MVRWEGSVVVVVGGRVGESGALTLTLSLVAY